MLRLWLVWVYFFGCFVVSGQAVRIDENEALLSDVVMKICKEGHLQVSFNDRQLSQYKVTCHGNFSSPDEALRFVIQNFPLAIERTGDVYLILQHRVQPKYLCSGLVVDNVSGEVLPFTHIQTSQTSLNSDVRGAFSFLADNAGPVGVTATYLGYKPLDTTLIMQPGVIIKLSPLQTQLSEITVLSHVGPVAGPLAGEMQLNQKVSSALPGGGQDALFNILRLQPGIMAAGELSQDLVIWGSYSGHSEVKFDGITLYGLKNFNDNISIINPNTAKYIKVLKGGYGVENGDKVGGVVDITGIDGNYTRTEKLVNINNTTATGLISVPVSKFTSAYVAFRKTYYNLYNPIAEKFTEGRGQNQSTVNIYPDYNFNDLNFKVSHRDSAHNMFYLSAFGSGDNFAYNINELVEKNPANFHTSSGNEVNKQNGVALFWGRTFSNGFISNLMISNTKFSNVFSQAQNVSTTDSINEQSNNVIHDFSIKLKNKHISQQGFKFESGVEFERYLLYLDITSLSSFDLNRNARSAIFAGYISQEYTTKTFIPVTIETGLRANYAAIANKIFLQPRVSLSVKTGKNSILNVAYGRYHQFTSHTPIVDDLGNIRYVWNLSDNKFVPVLSSNHYVAGWNFTKAGFSAVLEGYVKQTDGLIRILRYPDFQSQYNGNSISRGLDMCIKGEHGPLTAWISYSLSNSEEHFGYMNPGEYRPAIHNQRHEVKTAAICRSGSFSLSAAYVYGTGIPDPGTIIYPKLFETTIAPRKVDYHNYKRLDVALNYRKVKRNFIFEGGLSLLNITNDINIKYENNIRVSKNNNAVINLYSEAIPFTPLLNLSIRF